MTRQSISLAKQNDEWLKEQVEKEEFNSKSEAVNYLIKQARERQAYHEFVQMKIDRGNQSGFSSISKFEEIITEFKHKIKNE